ncbi:hypothetical protein IWZ03DRAFT_363511 [Phyllosticta citriasiana]|uniref:Uncharacterized protein n=1 Tax=Phyllosticta citriasiana TaxID=595635 RepID=A0ABR1K9P9_9PEZI
MANDLPSVLGFTMPAELEGNSAMAGIDFGARGRQIYQSPQQQQPPTTQHEGPAQRLPMKVERRQETPFRWPADDVKAGECSYVKSRRGYKGPRKRNALGEPVQHQPAGPAATESRDMTNLEPEHAFPAFAEAADSPETSSIFSVSVEDSAALAFSKARAYFANFAAAHPFLPPWPLLYLHKHTPFLTCGTVMAAVAHLAQWALVARNEPDAALDELIKIQVGSLRGLAAVWPLAARAVGHVRGVAGELWRVKGEVRRLWAQGQLHQQQQQQQQQQHGQNDSGALGGGSGSGDVGGVGNVGGLLELGPGAANLAVGGGGGMAQIQQPQQQQQQAVEVQDEPEGEEIMRLIEDAVTAAGQTQGIGAASG